MLDINTTYILLNGQGLLCLLLTLYYFINQPEVAKRKILLSYGFIIALTTASYSLISTTNITLATTASNILALTSLLIFMMCLVKFIQLKRGYAFLIVYFSAVALSIFYYIFEVNTNITSVTLIILSGLLYLILFYQLNVPHKTVFLKQTVIINTSVAINIITSLILTTHEYFKQLNAPLFSSQSTAIFITIFSWTSLVNVIGLIMITAENKRQSLAQLSQAKSKLIANVSHEIRTRMNGVLGMMTLLGNTPLNDQQRHKIAIAKYSANYLVTILNEMLDFTKIETGKLQLDISPVNLKKLIEQTAEIFALPCHQHGSELIFDTTELAEQIVKTDGSKISQFISALLAYAVKFSKNSEIVLSVKLSKTKEQQLMLLGSVKTTDENMSLSELNSLLKTVHLVDSSKISRYHGADLGLSISKNICELFSGTISTAAEKPQGCSINFTIPNIVEMQPAQAISAYDLTNKTILIADSNDNFLSLFHQQLEAMKAKVFIARTEQEAINIFNNTKTHIDFVFISEKVFTDDVELFMSQINQQEDSHSRFILLAYLDRPHDSQEINRAGIDFILYKPILTHQFNLLIEKLLVTPNISQFTDITHGIKKSLAHSQLVGKSLLLVEDNRVNQMVALGVLNQLGLRTLVAENGVEALKLLNKKGKSFDLILMDCLMPVMDGYQTTKEIRNGNAGANNKNIVIIALTANAMEEDREKCLNCGMNEVLTKPIVPDTLIETLLGWIVTDDEPRPSLIKLRH